MVLGVLLGRARGTRLLAQRLELRARFLGLAAAGAVGFAEQVAQGPEAECCHGVLARRWRNRKSCSTPHTGHRRDRPNSRIHWPPVGSRRTSAAPTASIANTAPTEQNTRWKGPAGRRIPCILPRVQVARGDADGKSGKGASESCRRAAAIWQARAAKRFQPLAKRLGSRDRLCQSRADPARRLGNRLILPCKTLSYYHENPYLIEGPDRAAGGDSVSRIASRPARSSRSSGSSAASIGSRGSLRRRTRAWSTGF